MLKSVPLAFSLSLILASMACATIYRCTLLDGTVVYGDKPVYVSDEYCRKVNETGPQDVFTDQRQRGDDRKAAPITKEGVKPIQKPNREKQTSNRDTFVTLKDQASSLLKDYKEARTRRYRASYLTEKQKAMREIKAIKSEKKALLIELDNGVFSQSQKDEINSILAEIPE